MSDRPPDDAGNLMSTWIPDDFDTAEFDRICVEQGPYDSRSAAVRDAMRILQAVEAVRPPTVADTAREKAAWVKSALKADLRRD